MMDITLQSNEGIISYYENVTYVLNGKKLKGTLYLTNLQLIFVQSKGVFQKQSIEYKLPFSQIKVINDKVQIVVHENKTTKIVEVTICMLQTQEKLEFQWADKSKVYHIADEISKQLTSTTYDKSDSKKDSFAYKTGTFIKNTVSSFTEGLFSHDKKTVTKKCKVCKAEIKGLKDEDVTCKYCGNTQKL